MSERFDHELPFVGQAPTLTEKKIQTIEIENL